MRKATIIPLDYTLEGKPTRKEHSIVYVSQDWEELEDLLTVPIEFMRTMQQRWPQVIGGSSDGPPIDWELIAPVNATISCGYADATNMLLMSQYLQLEPFLPLATEAKEEAVAGNQQVYVGPFNPVIWDHVDGLVYKFIDEFKEGSFYAEFAPRTSTLNIKYYPPQKCFKRFAASILNPKSEPDPSRMNKEFTRATLGIIGKVNGVGTVHFDIGDSPEDRAKFILDHIENSGHTCQKLNQGVNGDRMFSLSYMEFVDERKPVHICDLERREIPKPFSIIDPESQIMASIKSVSEQGGSGDSLKPLLQTAMPTMLIEGLSTRHPMQVCGQGTVYEAKKAFVFGNLTLKDYYPPPPPHG